MSMTSRTSPMKNSSALLLRRRALREEQLRRKLRAQKQQAQTSLIGFTQYTFPRYQAEPFHRLVAAYLDRVIAGDIRRLMIFAPPQHGKSELVSVRFPAYWMGRRPDDPVIITSYAADLAYSKSRQARQVVESREFAGLFPGVGTNPESRAVNNWVLAAPHRGELVAAGVGGPITGHGAMLGIIDDPVENWEQAQSEAYRNRAWEWYRGTFRTRIWEEGAIVLIMCMTGDTRVLMEDGREKLLRDIRPGDRVATYDNGNVRASKVVNWRNNGPDRVYAIKMKSGIVAYANARHPFLVEEGGRSRWQRTAALKKGDIILRVIGASGGAWSAPSRDVTSQPNPKACATRTTTKPDGPLGFARLRSILCRGVRRVCATVTESARVSTSAFWLNRAECALSASSLRRARTPGLIGEMSSALTIATKPERYADFSATTATLRSGTGSQQIPCPPPLSTCDVVRDTVVEVVESGFENVFDIQVERTENFIANGLISHNTRWHEDDLAGKLLAHDEGEWTVLRLPALSEGQGDPLGRAEGEALSPGRYSTDALLSLKHDVGAMAWAAEYQGTPRAPEGNRFKRYWFEIVPAGAARAYRVRYWDKAGTRDGGDYTAGVLMSWVPGGYWYVEDVVRGQWSSLERETVIRRTTEQDYDRYGQVEVWLEQEPGSGGRDSAEFTIRNLAGFTAYAERASGTKEIRAEPFAAQCEAGNVKLVRGDWNESYLDELTVFPNGLHDDQVDASSGAFNRLLGLGQSYEETVEFYDPVSISPF